MKRAFLAVLLLLPISWACGASTPPPAEATEKRQPSAA